jgi:hypothetical protein
MMPVTNIILKEKSITEITQNYKNESPERRSRIIVETACVI